MNLDSQPGNLLKKNHGDGGESCIHRGVLSLNKLGNPNFPARFAHSREIGIRPFGGLLGGYPQIPDKVFPLKNTACLQFLAIGILITMRLPPPLKTETKNLRARSGRIYKGCGLNFWNVQGV